MHRKSLALVDPPPRPQPMRTAPMTRHTPSCCSFVYCWEIENLRASYPPPSPPPTHTQRTASPARWLVLSACGAEAALRTEAPPPATSASFFEAPAAAVLEALGLARCSTAMLVYAGLLSYFLAEYMFWEEPHLYTYDLFCEKLGWGP